MTLLGTTAHVFSAGFGSVSTFSTANALSITARSARLAGATVSVRYDERLLAMQSLQSVASYDDTILPLVATSRGTSAFDIVLPEMLPSVGEFVTLVVTLPLGVRDLYPHEDVGPVSATVATVTPVGALRPLATTATPSTGQFDGPAWGAELAAVWADVDNPRLPGGFGYSYPAFLRLTSAGPSPLPAGSTVVIMVDSQIADMTMEEAFSGDEAKAPVRAIVSRPAPGSTSIVLPAALPAGQSVSFALRAAPASDAPSTHDVTFARAFVVPPGKPSPLQRSTGREATVAVSASGVPRIAAAFSGKN